MEKELASKYARLIRQKAIPYCIDENKQPHFWEAVLLLCQDKKADIVPMIVGGHSADPFCVTIINYTGTARYGVSRFSDYSAHTVLELVHKIAEEITSWDSMSLDDMKLMLLSINYYELKRGKKQINRL